jgi:TRAP-type C4-dicarboxylate transport system permease large subunit
MSFSNILLVRKFKSLVTETFFLIKQEKAYFIAPIVLFLLFLGIFIYNVGPAVVLTFIYAGI